MSDMTLAMNPAASDHVPWFVVAPGQTDVLMNVAVIFLVCLIFAFGTLYLRLHALPDQIAHRGTKLQLQLVGVLALIGLLTHNNAFWIAALLIAIIEIPDFSGIFSSMARSLERIAPKPIAETPQETPEQMVDESSPAPQPVQGV